MLRSWDGRVKDSLKEKSYRFPLKHLSPSAFSDCPHSFKEDLCLEIEKTYRENRASALEIFIHLRGRTLPNDDAAFALLLRYLRRFLPIFGHELLRPWHSRIFERLSSTVPELVEELVLLLKELLIADDTTRVRLLRDRSPTAKEAMVLFAREKSIEFFNTVSEELDPGISAEFQWKALLIVTEVAHSQGPNLDLAAKSHFWDRLINILETHEGFVLLQASLSTLLMLLPSNLREFSSSDLFLRLCKIYLRFISLPEPDGDRALASSYKEIQSSAQLLLEFLYGLFPHNLLQFFRSQMDLPNLAKGLQLRISRLPFNPKLLEATPSNEFALDRWKNADVTKEIFTFLSRRVNLNSFRETSAASESDSENFNIETHSFDYFLHRAESQEGFSLSSAPKVTFRAEESSDTLREQVVVLKARLLYEQYVQKLFSDRMALFTRESDELRRVKESQADLERELAESRRMHAHLVQQHVEQHRQTTSLKEANVALRANLNKSTQLFQMRESDLKEQNARLTLEQESLQQQVKNLSRERNEQASVIFQQQALVESMNRRLNEQDSEGRRQLVLQEELLVLQEQRKEAEIAKIQLAEAENALIILENELAQTSEAALRLEEQLTEKKNECADQARQIVDLELEVDRVNLQNNEFKAAMEAAKEMQQLKHDAQQRKFEAMRDRALLLEQKILQLQADAEKRQEGQTLSKQ